MLDVADSTDTLDIWVVNLTNWSARELVDCAAPCLWAQEPAWSHDDTSLVFEQTSAEGTMFLGVSLEVLDLATPGVTRTNVPADRMANNADWSPDGTLIAFSAPITGGEPGGALSDVWVVHPDGTVPRRITDVAASGGTAVQPTFTPDGASIMFKLMDERVGASDAIATVSIAGGEPRSPAGPGGPLRVVARMCCRRSGERDRSRGRRPESDARRSSGMRYLRLIPDCPAPRARPMPTPMASQSARLSVATPSATPTPAPMAIQVASVSRLSRMVRISPVGRAPSPPAWRESCTRLCSFASAIRIDACEHRSWPRSARGAKQRRRAPPDGAWDSPPYSATTLDWYALG